MTVTMTVCNYDCDYDGTCSKYAHSEMTLGSSRCYSPWQFKMLVAIHKHYSVEDWHRFAAEKPEVHRHSNATNNWY